MTGKYNICVEFDIADNVLIRIRWFKDWCEHKRSFVITVDFSDARSKSTLVYRLKLNRHHSYLYKLLHLLKTQSKSHKHNKTYKKRKTGTQHELSKKYSKKKIIL